MNIYGIVCKTKNINKINNISLLTRHIASENEQWQERSHRTQVSFYNIYQLRDNTTSKNTWKLQTHKTFT